MIDLNWSLNRTAVVATMHRKETIIAPLFEAAFGMKIIVPSEFDTDRFGTFTREVQRLGTQMETARLKARRALEKTEATIGIASEGSFGPHVQCPWIASNREVLLLIDIQHNFEVYADELSLKTNFAHADVSCVEEAMAFAKKVHFPSHALVATTDPEEPQALVRYKGITHWDDLSEKVKSLLNQSSTGLVRLETDMRAMFNPTRMEVIEQTTRKLIQKLNRICPRCNCPGFDVIEETRGLPCAWCHEPTNQIKTVIDGCQHCTFQQERQDIMLPKLADPGQCLRCNP